MRAIAKAMGFPAELWFEEDLGDEGGGSLAGPEGNGIPKAQALFKTIKDPKTGEPYTNAYFTAIAAG
jgi:hypothetical protein